MLMARTGEICSDGAVYARGQARAMRAPGPDSPRPDRTGQTTFGTLLRQYRLTAGLSQETLAERAGMSVQGLNALENGKRQTPYRHTVTLLAQALGLSATDTAALEATVMRGRRSASPATTASAHQAGAVAAGAEPAHAEPDAAHPHVPVGFPPLASLQAHPSNLPAALTSFIGREEEQAEVRALLGTARLVTLTGVGGAGKTRLALAVAEELLDEYSEGIWLVELAPLADPALVVQVVGQTLGLREETGRPLLDTLLSHLRSRQLLLVLDNCEHLVAACADLVMALLRGCPRLQFLATSREGLGVAGERRYQVPSLPVPSLDHLPSPADLGRYAAVALFVARAQERRAGFALTARNARAVVHVCTRLDGMPLAIELAAARIGSLPVEAIAARLDDRFRLLTGGPRTAMPRQQTLRATLDWSYDLLSEPEQLLLRRLSVFSGGWTLAAAEAVCARDGVAAWELLDLLDSLVSKSLVLLEETGPVEEQGRYRLLETVRQYGLEQLVAAGEDVMARDHHLAHFLALVEEAEPLLRGPEQGEWLARLEMEHDNLRAALRWTLECGETEKGLRLGGVLWRFWYVRGHVREGRQWLDYLLAKERKGLVRAAPAVRAKAFNGAGVLADIQDDYASAKAQYEESLTLQRELGDKQGIAACLNNLGNVAINQGDYERAEILHEESLALRREGGDPRAIAISLNNLGRVTSCRGSYVRAMQLYEESLALHQAAGDTGGAAGTLSNLASVVAKQGNYTRAVTLHEQSLKLTEALNDTQGIALGLSNLARAVRQQGDGARALDLYTRSLSLYLRIGDTMGVATCLEGMAGMIAAQQPEQAVCLFGMAAALRTTTGASLPPDEQAAVDRDLAGARNAVTAVTFAAAWTAGQSLSLEQAVTVATGIVPWVEQGA